MTFDPSTIEGALLWAVVAFVLTVSVILLLRRSSRRAIDRVDGPKAEATRQRIRFTTQLLQVATAGFGVVLFAHGIPALRPVGTALLASASVVTIVLGIAAQTTLGNLLAGVSIVMFKPFEAGDRIQLAGPGGPETGVVETVNLGNTIVSTFDNRRIVVPNGQLVNQTTVNLSSVTERILAQVTVWVGYGTAIDDARSALQRIVEDHDDCDELQSILVTELGPYYVGITAFVWCPDSLAGRRLEYAVYERALVDLPANGVGIPYPTSAVHLVSSAPGTTESVVS